MIDEMSGAPSTWPSSPVPNSYWVEPGRLLAGEYPGSLRGEPQERIEALLRAGITSFVDLTGEGELPAYNLRFGEIDAIHRRFAIADHGVPSSPDVMQHVVTAIAADLAAGRRVYVHCRAGIGRTGMAIGCYLIHRGLDGAAALDTLQTLWQRCARSRTWPSVPETDEQVRFVRMWSAPNSVSKAHRVTGAFIGLAVGEGLAITTLAQRLHQEAWHAESKRLERLPTGADTAMTIAVGESLLERGGHDGHDQLQRYLAWTQQSDMQGRIPAELKRALGVWQWSRKPNPGSHDPKNLDPHSLARTLSAAMFAKGDGVRAAELAVEVSRTTQQSPLVLDACRVWAATLSDALNGDAKAELLELRSARAAVRQRQIRPQIAALLDGDWRRAEPAEGALALLAKVFDIFRSTQTFESAIREAVYVSTTCAAWVGALAGAHYGSTAVPIEWRRAAPEHERLAQLASRFAS